MKQLSSKNNSLFIVLKKKGLCGCPMKKHQGWVGGREEGESVGKGLYCYCYTIQWVRRSGKQA